MKTLRSRLTSSALLSVAIVGALALGATNASAIPIAAGSTLDFAGGIDPIGGANLYDATGVDFRTSGVASPGTDGTTHINSTGSGSFSVFDSALCPSAAAGGCGTLKDLLTFDPVANTLSSPALPVSSFIRFFQGVTTVSFDLLSFSLTDIHPTVSQLGTLIISGNGLLHMNGFDNTPGIFTLTSQGPGNSSFSASLVAQAVPEPGSMLLLGAGLAGMMALRRRKSA